MKIDQLVSYLNEEKINLAPPFQRGHVWSVGTRRKLLQNMVAGKPIPAVFLYKEASGSKYSYNILDGKQRLESLILFINNARQDFQIPKWDRYFFEQSERRHSGYWIRLDGKKIRFNELQEDLVRDFREYAIPTVEMALDDDTSLDEVISLFVDINQQGVPVNRFDIVKAMYKTDQILRQAFKLLAVEQRRGQDVLYKMVNNEFTFVLKRLQTVSSVPESNSKVDRMWERLLEFSIYALTKEHRKPVDILKGFMSGKQSNTYRLTNAELRSLRQVFRFLKHAYKTTNLGTSRLATDQTHFYVLTTSLISSQIFGGMTTDQLSSALVSIASAMEPRGQKLSSTADRLLKQYMKLSEKQTTDVAKRQDRESLFKKLVASASGRQPAAAAP